MVEAVGLAPRSAPRPVAPRVAVDGAEGVRPAGQPSEQEQLGGVVALADLDPPTPEAARACAGEGDDLALGGLGAGRVEVPREHPRTSPARSAPPSASRVRTLTRSSRWEVGAWSVWTSTPAVRTARWRSGHSSPGQGRQHCLDPRPRGDHHLEPPRVRRRGRALQPCALQRRLPQRPRRPRHLLQAYDVRPEGEQHLGLGCRHPHPSGHVPGDESRTSTPQAAWVPARRSSVLPPRCAA